MRRNYPLNNWKRALGSLIPDTHSVVQRFSLPCVLAAVFAALIIIKANTGLIADGSAWGLLTGIALAFYLLVILQLWYEAGGRQSSLALQLLICTGAIALCWFHQHVQFLSPLALGASLLTLGLAPFLSLPRDDESVWNFTHKVWVAVIFTLTGTMIYFVGVQAISTVLDKLFGVVIYRFVQNWLLPIGFGFLAPMAWLSMLPAHDDDDTDSLRNPGFISRSIGFLGTWILVPLTTIYGIILLSYGLKILLNMTLPNGEIASFVTPFLFIGTLTWLILDPPFLQRKRLARWYTKLWFPVMIPVTLLLAIALRIRVAEYGWTLERYLLGATVVWALCVALWFTVAGKRHRDIRIIPGLAAVILALSSVGPWGADGLSAADQQQRLKRALTDADMLDDSGHLKPLTELKIDNQQLGRRARGALEYLILRNKKKSIFAMLPVDEIDNTDLYSNENVDFDDTSKSTDDAKSTNKHLKRDALLDRFALDNEKFIGKFTNRYEDSQIFSRNDKPVPISGYEYISRYMTFYPQSYQQYGDFAIRIDNEQFVIEKSGEEITRIDPADQIIPAAIEGTLDPHQILYRDAQLIIAIFIDHIALNNLQNSNDGFDIGFSVLLKGIGNL